LIAAYGVQNTLIVLGAAFLLIAVAAAQCLRPAPADYAPPGWTPVVQQASGFAAETTLGEALRTPHWYLLWSILALNVTAGAALISVAAPLAQELTQVGPALGTVRSGPLSYGRAVRSDRSCPLSAQGGARA
jgi:OFA family oxalate/formate antiporter-like MFS transporter